MKTKFLTQVSFGFSNFWYYYILLNCYVNLKKEKNLHEISLKLKVLKRYDQYNKTNECLRGLPFSTFKLTRNLSKLCL